jgi:hypothetical protein
MNQRSSWKSTAALVSIILCTLSWELTAAMFIGRRLFGADWFGPDREWGALTVSIILSFYHAFIGRRLIQQHSKPCDPSQRALTTWQAIIVILLFVSAGAFGTWLFCHGPEYMFAGR